MIFITYFLLLVGIQVTKMDSRFIDGYAPTHDSFRFDHIICPRLQKINSTGQNVTASDKITLHQEGDATNADE